MVAGSSYRSRVALVAALLTAAAVLVIVAVHTTPRPYAAPPTGSAPPAARTTTAAPAAAGPTTSAAARKPPQVAGYAWLDILVVAVVGFIVLVSLGAVLTLLVLGLRRLRRPGRSGRVAAAARSARPPGESDDPAEIAAAVDAGLAELDVGEPDDAIIACWLRLSDAARDVGIEARRSDTPHDFVARVAGTRRVHPDALNRLAVLYREARFSEHAMTEDDRAAARAALESVRRDLRFEARA